MEHELEMGNIFPMGFFGISVEAPQKRNSKYNFNMSQHRQITAIEVCNVKHVVESECVHSIVTFHREVWISNECEIKYG